VREKALKPKVDFERYLRNNRMRSNSTITSFFMTVTDVQDNTHVTTVFFTSLLDLQMNEDRVRKEYEADNFIVMTHPAKHDVKSDELKEIYHQANMQLLIMHGLQQQRTR
jgi:predicted NAD/FAD-dependent oxidoreductase